MQEGQQVNGFAAYDEDGYCSMVAATKEELIAELGIECRHSITPAKLVYTVLPWSGKLRLVHIMSEAGQESQQ